MAMRLPVLALAFALLTPLLAGCLGDEAEAPSDGDAALVAASAEDAGAVSGKAPVAPKGAYTVQAEEGRPVTAHPVAVETTPAKPPVTLDFSGQFTAADCRPLRMGPLEDPLSAASTPHRMFRLTDTLAVGDVFSYNVTLSYRNSDTARAEIHPMFAIGSTIVEHEETTIDTEEVTLSWSGQGYRASEDDPAAVGLECWYGFLTQPISYTYTVTLAFAEAAVPAEAPMLLTVPEGVTKLFVSGLPLDESQGVLSHFRVFHPDDTMLCECTLSSNQPVAVVELPAPGDYVLLVDHTDNGFVSVAFDAPPTAPLRALESEWVELLVLTSEGGAVDQAVELDLPRVPLFMHAWVFSRETEPAAGGGQRTKLHVSNDRGEVMRYGWGGHLTFQDPQGAGTAWLGLPTISAGDTPAWEAWTDHHAYSPGAHTAHVQAEFLRGDVWILYRQYVR